MGDPRPRSIQDFLDDFDQICLAFWQKLEGRKSLHEYGASVTQHSPLLPTHSPAMELQGYPQLKLSAGESLDGTKREPPD
ncbi:Hypothetical predicted protein [Pelobates cultripes]|uniref:Uncharacterized protein n=1 Tax=Pelobates cultripes TaxID=61616 RepID=A0AAD1VYU0_PELCU|nr:Hypothetical predicted protein [Pelobates cultripes]